MLTFLRNMGETWTFRIHKIFMPLVLVTWNKIQWANEYTWNETKSIPWNSKHQSTTFHLCQNLCAFQLKNPSFWFPAIKIWTSSRTMIILTNPCVTPTQIQTDFLSTTSIQEVLLQCSGLLLFNNLYTERFTSSTSCGVSNKCNSRMEITILSLHCISSEQHEDDEKPNSGSSS